MKIITRGNRVCTRKKKRLQGGIFAPLLLFVKSDIRGAESISAAESLSIGRLLMHALSGSYSHSKIAGAFIVPPDNRKRWFGSSARFHEICTTTGLIEKVSGASKAAGVAEAYAMTDYGHSFLESFFEQDFLNLPEDQRTIIDEQGKRYRVQKHGIASKTISGSLTAYPHDKVPCLVPIDKTRLRGFVAAAEAWRMCLPAPDGFARQHEEWDERLREYGAESTRERVRYASYQAHSVLCFAACVGDGSRFPVRYEEHSTGRLYAAGSLNIQTCRREVRRAALHGCWDADVGNAHFALLAHFADRIGAPHPVIDGYLRNKKQVRAEIAAELGIGVAKVKTLLVSLVYGASIYANTEKSAIVQTVGADIAPFVARCTWLRALQKEIGSLGKAIIADHLRENPRLLNAMGKVFAGGADGTQAEKLSHILQGAESRILKCVIEHYGPNLRALLHDGFVIAHEIDPHELHCLVLKETGYSVDFEVEKL